jgi:hypothetical protein
MFAAGSTPTTGAANVSARAIVNRPVPEPRSTTRLTG